MQIRLFDRLQRPNKRTMIAPSSPQANPPCLQLTSVRTSSLCKHITSQESDGYILQKAEMPFESHDFCWNLSKMNSSSKDLVMIECDNDRGIIMLATVDGDLTALSTRWNQMYTVVRFWWGNRSYRWMMSWMTVGNSINHLKIQLLQDGCPQPLACIEGPGCQRKQFWVQLNKPDTISLFCDIQDPMWLQVIIASGLVAAKVQRRRDKAMPAALKRRWK